MGGRQMCTRVVVIGAAARPLATVAKLPAGVGAALEYNDGRVVTAPPGRVVLRWEELAAVSFVAPRRVWYDAAGRHKGLLVRCMVEPREV